jgi:hypothetical protein
LIARYKTIVKTLQQKLAEWPWADHVNSLYRELFTKARVIVHDLKEDELLKQLDWRYRHGVPPGYKDKDKADSGIGDLVIWHSILKLGKERQAHVIFVSNEAKQDWVYRSEKEALMPRLELCVEFHRETGHHFGLTNWKGFLKSAGVRAETVHEAERAEHWASEPPSIPGHLLFGGMPFPVDVWLEIQSNGRMAWYGRFQIGNEAPVQIGEVYLLILDDGRQGRLRVTDQVGAAGDDAGPFWVMWEFTGVGDLRGHRGDERMS